MLSGHLRESFSFIEMWSLSDLYCLLEQEGEEDTDDDLWWTRQVWWMEEAML